MAIWSTRAQSGHEVSVDRLHALKQVTISGVEAVWTDGLWPSLDLNTLDILNDDPQITLSLCDEHSNKLFLQISFEAEGRDSDLSNPRLYIDYTGRGFEQEASFVLTQQLDRFYRAIIAFPALQPVLRWDPSERAGQMNLKSIVAQAWVNPRDLSTSVSSLSASPASESERKAWAARAIALSLSMNQEILNAKVERTYSYRQWVELRDISAKYKYSEYGYKLSECQNAPKFSFVIPTYNSPTDLLEACIQSLKTQVYTKFEICIADDNSKDSAVRLALERLARSDERIKLCFREQNGHISEASNSALAMATGDFIVLVDHDDIIPDYALLIVADYVNRFPSAKILYSDEDKLDPSGERRDPYFKSNFNRFLMFGHNMVSHLGVYDRKLVNALGGFRKGYEGSQDYDLFLRCLAECSDCDIIHIPHILYHWRMIPGSTSVSADQKSYAIVAARKSLNDFFLKERLPFRSVEGLTDGVSAIEIVGPIPETPISIIIPTRDRLDLLRPCMESLRHYISGSVDVIIIDNGSIESETLDYFEVVQSNERVRVLGSPGEFNFSRICNEGAVAAKGEILCFLNNDTEVVAPQWLDRARAFLSVSDVGIVGARLLYPDDTVQHFGLYLGMGAHGVAGTPYRGLSRSNFGSFGKARLVQEFSAVTAACMFVKRSVYESVGGFDPTLRVAYNDVDFCLKVRALGLKVLCDPEIELIHKESKSRGSDTDIARGQRLEEEAALMRNRWGALLQNDPYYNPNLTLERDDFGFAAVPRVAFPWQRSEPDFVDHAPDIPSNRGQRPSV